MKKLLSLWFDSDYRTYPFSLFPWINIINSRIKNPTLPSFIPRILRKLNDLSYWKASELKVFLLIYCLPVLNHIMSFEYFEHIKLLVHGITLLNYSSISEEMVNEASRSLREFVLRYEILYSMRFMTCNLHLLLHLPNDVRKFSPLFIMSCFPFENMNGILNKYVHGSRYPQLQIISAVSMFLSSMEVQEKFLRINSATSLFCKKIDSSGIRRYKTKHLQNSTYVVGAYSKLKTLPTQILNVTQSIQNFDLSKSHFFHRLLKSGIYYETENDVNRKKTNSVLIKYVYNNENHFGILQYFLRVCTCTCNDV